LFPWSHPAPIALTLALLAAAIGPAFANPPASFDDPELIAKGRQLFDEKHCAKCHGEGGTGNPRLAGRLDLQPEDVFRTVRDGRRGMAVMPSFRSSMNEDEMWAIAAYIRSLREKGP
jgi:mono/diheme cytochrome c family protein